MERKHSGSRVFSLEVDDEEEEKEEEEVEEGEVVPNVRCYH